MTNKNTMPKEVWLFNSGYCGIGDLGFTSTEEKEDHIKYTRLDPDDIVLSRKELEGMKRLEDESSDDFNTRDVQVFCYGCASGYNNAINKILEMSK